MRIKVEPKEFFMYAVYLAFDRQNPNGEDEHVRAYLAEHELEPRGRGVESVEGRESDVMYFGGCYLGRHLKVIGDMQKQAVEQELLTSDIERAINDVENPATPGDVEMIHEPRRTELITALVKEFHQETSFEADEEGRLKVTLEASLIQNKFRKLQSKRSEG